MHLSLGSGDGDILYSQRVNEVVDFSGAACQPEQQVAAIIVTQGYRVAQDFSNGDFGVSCLVFVT